MKNSSRYIAIVACLLYSIFQAEAQTYHEWPSTVGNMSYTQGGTHIIILKNNVQITGTITVGNATTLRILNTSPNDLTISNGISGRRDTPMFRVIGNAKLAFNYNDRDEEDLVPGYDGTRYRRIIMDGGAAFGQMDRTSDKDGVWRLTATTDKRFTVSAIQSIGAIEIYNTTIRNFYIPEDASKEHGVIGLATTDMVDHVGNTGNVNNYRYTTLKNCLIERCKGVLGTVIMVGNGNAFMRPDIDPTAKDEFGSYRYITLDGVTIRDCVTFCDNNGWGGLIRCRGGSRHSMKLINSTFTGNFSHGDGAVLWWNACGHPNTTCTIDGCSFTGNRAMREAGAIRMEGSLNFVGGTTYVTGNECLGKQRNEAVNPNTYTPDPNFLGNGGGIQIYGYAGGAELDEAILTYKLPSCLIVKNNYAAGYGGGIAFDFTDRSTLPAGSVLNAYFEGVSVTENEAEMGGGGLLFRDKTGKDYTFNLYLINGAIDDNTAPDGGGMFVQNINVDSRAGNPVTINRNTATSGCGGGVYLEDGTITLNSVTISDNKVYKGSQGGIYGGGGLFVKGGSFTINSGAIKNNISDQYGGGVLVYNNTGTRKPITLVNGDIQANKALYGGGIAAYGALNLTINNINIENNEARNGAGVFTKGITAGSEAVLQYRSGIIRYNRARSYETSVMTTAYNKTHNTYSGVGGGIYMGQFSNLTISKPELFGIYSNIADNGADEIFGYNKNVEIELPNLSRLALSGYNDAKIHELFWAEDYITNDVYYDKGTKLKGALWNTDRTNQRYRDVRENGLPGAIYLMDFEGASTKYFGSSNNISTYLSLTIGWNVSTINLVKKGMKDGESAIFKLYKVNGSTETEYMTVVLSDKDTQADGSRKKSITLSDDGVWKIVETGWSWGYVPQVQSIQRELKMQSSEAERTFEFTNTRKQDVPQHGESIKINKIK